MPRALLVDGHSLLFRAYHALPPLARPDGTPTGAVFGFAQMLLKVLDDTRPGSVVVAFDAAAPTFRHEAFDQYKANREEAPDDFHVQTPLAQELLQHLGIAHREWPGFEADDILGSLAVAGKAAGWDILILTGDRDLLQLVGPGVTVLLTGRGGLTQLEAMDREAVIRKMGVRPEQVPDLKGLMGDSSDNIPGVPGIGEKSAVTLLTRYERIEDIFAHLDEIPEGRFKKALTGHESDAFASRELATIRTDLAVEPLTGAEGPFEIARTEALAAFLTDMGFGSLRRRLYEVAPVAKKPSKSGVSADRADDLAEAEIADTLEEWAAWPAESPLGIEKLADGYLLGTPDGRLGRYRGPIGGDKDQRLVGFKIKSFVDDVPQSVRGRLDDGELAAYLLDAGRSRYAVADLVRRAGGEPRDDVAALAAVWPAVRELMVAQGLWDLYERVELPLLHVLRRMERHGIRVDGATLDVLAGELEVAIANLEREIHEMAGFAFNINSTGQLGEVLFDKLGLPSGRRTKTGYSTDADVLESLRPMHPIVDAVLIYRQLTKLKGTYVDGLRPLLVNGRLHTHFNQTVAATGRLSSSDPNLQNIPVRLPLGRRIRRVFLPDEGRVLFSADYSQIELRVLAHFSDDPVLKDAFASGQDIHRRTASEMFQVPLDEVSDELRSHAKAINFGIIYGISDYGLANNTGVSRQDAANYIRQYFARYPRIKEFLDGAIQQGRRDGFVTTILGRRRYLPDIENRNYARRQYAERMAMNTVLQGTAADLIKVAMIRLDQAFSEQGLESAMVLQVHDELIWDMVPAEEEVVADLARRLMTTAIPLSVPLVIDFKRGTDWESMEPWVDAEGGRAGAGTARG